MPLSKTLQRVFVDGYQVVRSGYLRLHDDIEQRFGTGDDVAQKYDSTNDRFVQDDRSGTTQVQIDVGNDLTDELEAGGLMELVIGNLLNFDPTQVLITTRANQPAAGTADRVAIITDATGGPVIERDDGAAWNVIGASSGALEQGGADALVAEALGTNIGSGSVLKGDGSGGLVEGSDTGAATTAADQVVASLGG